MKSSAKREFSCVCVSMWIEPYGEWVNETYALHLNPSENIRLYLLHNKLTCSNSEASDMVNKAKLSLITSAVDVGLPIDPSRVGKKTVNNSSAVRDGALLLLDLPELAVRYRDSEGPLPSKAKPDSIRCPKSSARSNPSHSKKRVEPQVIGKRRAANQLFSIPSTPDRSCSGDSEEVKIIKTEYCSSSKKREVKAERKTKGKDTNGSAKVKHCERIQE